MKYKLLVVDDEEDILEFLSYNLLKAGFDVKTALNGEEALEALKTYAADLILLDIMMPIMDGLTCCQELRKHTQYDNLSIIFLTARADEETQIKSLDQGADDFIAKPVNMNVLLSRIRAVIRRKLKPLDTGEQDQILIFDGIQINPLKMEVIYKGTIVEFAKKEFLLLYLLASYPGKVFKREEILDKIWGKDIIVGDRTIDVHIRKLREKLENSYIKTIKGVGYKFDI
ncbi:MAG: response regulator transcription factor [Saprospiraceae bacterium]|nr:response regulator transcription factor [Saprospiraceae bacterium]MBK8449799.1 response regulator transcription factor [Saprospiraceae bacterium]MBK8484144.1 response regulator transcription factor [Saprospiraceae bacterium]MBK9221548.1 response regulator transcription factor [Saprospiraceae bacterium]MBK9721515.1 response regulator transcription factor [Saprospiraceae bacterium]